MPTNPPMPNNRKRPVLIDDADSDGASEALLESLPNFTNDTQGKRYIATIAPGDDELLPPELGEAILKLEQELDMSLWVLLLKDGRNGDLDLLTGWAVDQLQARRAELPSDKRLALLIHSAGGSADAAYEIAMLLRRHCGGFIAVIPRYAKSAATLLALGAQEIWLGDSAQLGPVDAQIRDYERETELSALDEVQALERLHAFSLEAADRTLLSLKRRTRKQYSTLLPLALDFAANLMRPLLDKIDTVHYTQMDRTLREAEEYAARLLIPLHSVQQARRIAHQLVTAYPTHGFIIDAAEASALGLRVKSPMADTIEAAMEALVPYLGTVTVIGRVQEVTA